jgi:catechol 2,3-dioxygenase-like lactoylglutathione lyase family enzyme
MPISVGTLDHVNIRTRMLADTVRFYEDALGLTVGPRPAFSFPGAWLYSEGRAVVHLIDVSPTDEPQKPDSGVVDHVAFVSRGYGGMKTHLAAQRVKFRTVKVPGNELWQIFIRDPNGVMIELNYDARNETDAGPSSSELFETVDRL